MEFDKGAYNMNATDDTRTANNTMRHQYRVLDDAEKEQITLIKGIGLTFINECNNIGSSRELSLAKTKMEEAVFWAVKHITN